MYFLTHFFYKFHLCRLRVFQTLEIEVRKLDHIKQQLLEYFQQKERLFNQRMKNKRIISHEEKVNPIDDLESLNTITGPFLIKLLKKIF